jgi:predicted DNA-binding transcriptional regulator YafY
MASADKLTRWLDLLAALLRRRTPVAFAEFRHDVPGYKAGAVDEKSIARSFERDKDELRAFGVAIETVQDADGSESRYRLRHEAFYLPFLALCETQMVSALELRTIPRPQGIGYQMLPVLAITPDECLMLRRAAARVRALGNETLEADAISAIRKLENDVGLLPVAEPLVAAVKVQAGLFDLLRSALMSRKRVTFTYAGMGKSDASTRMVEPYGLVFLTGHWYLVAYDPAQDALRQFRVSRMTTLKSASGKTADYQIPAHFDLEAHAASRQAWELGDEDAAVVVVQFHGDSGHVLHGMKLGEAHGDVATERWFRVRRGGPFMRWLLTFGGEATIISPPEWRSRWRTLVQETLVAHSSAAMVEEA